MSIRFIKGEKPQTIKDGSFEYQAGKLSYAGNKSTSAVYSTISRYLKDTWGWTEEGTDEITSVDAFSAANALLKDKALLILTCDYSQTLTPADLLEWPESWVDACYKLAVELNPQFEDKPNNQAQPETKNPDGTPKLEEQTPPN